MSDSCDDTVDCSPPGSSVHGISQGRVLEWVAIAFSRALPDPGVKPATLALAGGFLTTVPHGKPQFFYPSLIKVCHPFDSEENPKGYMLMAQVPESVHKVGVNSWLSFLPILRDLFVATDSQSNPIQSKGVLYVLRVYIFLFLILISFNRCLFVYKDNIAWAFEFLLKGWFFHWLFLTYLLDFCDIRRTYL